MAARRSLPNKDFASIAVVLLILLAAGIYCRYLGIADGSGIITAALAGLGILVKAWIDKAKDVRPTKGPQSTRRPGQAQMDKRRDRKAA